MSVMQATALAHIVADCKYDLPISVLVTPANSMDMVVAPELLSRTAARFRSLHPSRVMGDAGYDSRAVYEAITTLGATPIIKMNPRGKVRVPASRSYRLYPGVPLDFKAWHRHYN